MMGNSILGTWQELPSLCIQIKANLPSDRPEPFRRYNTISHFIQQRQGYPASPYLPQSYPRPLSCDRSSSCIARAVTRREV